jgi:membrane protein implicated in regulation of membrane protease activity
LVTEIIDHSSGTGTVKIGGELWRAVTPDESRVDIGQKVVVREVDGCKVAVEVVTAIQWRAL